MQRSAVLLLFLLAFAGEAHAAGGEKKKGGGRAFVQLAPLAATVMRPDGRRGVLTVETGLDALQARAVSAMPRLRAAYSTVVQRHAAGLGPGYAPNADRLAADLQRETDRVLGKPGAKLLLGTLIIN